jgi:hypothetical protein
VVIDALSNNDLVRAGELILSSSTGHAPASSLVQVVSATDSAAT